MGTRHATRPVKMPRRSGTRSQSRQVLGGINRQSSFVNQLNPSAYDPDQAPPTCRSALPHGPEAIRDHVKHYFACIEFAERVKFFDRENEVWRYEHEVELKIVKSLPEFSATDEETIQNEVKRRVSETLGGVAAAIEAQYQRTQTLRKALRNASVPQVNTRKKSEEPSGTGNVVLDVEKSRSAWKSSQEFSEGVQHVKTWKRGQPQTPIPSAGPVPAAAAGGPSDSAAHKPVEIPQKQPSADSGEPIESERKRAQQVIAEHTGRQATDDDDDDEEDYDLEQDINAYLIQYTRQQEPRNKAISLASARPGTPEYHSQMTTDSQTTTGQTSTSHGLRGRRLIPVDEDLKDPRFKGRFPGQRLSMRLLLGDPATGLSHDSNILSGERCKQADRDRIRYFHLPSNNMEVRNAASKSSPRIADNKS